MRIALAGLTGFLIAAAPSTAPSTGPATRPVTDVSAKIAEVLTTHSVKGLVPGLAGAAVRLDGVTAVGVAGVRKSGSPGRILRGDLFHLGSDTKSMTAVLIGQLVDQKKIKFESTMGELFPKLAGDMNPEMAKVTVRQLLEHRGGLVANTGWWTFEKMPGSMAVRRLAVVKAVLAIPPVDQPGTKMVYSNCGYMVLGAIVEAIEGKAWEQVIREKLFVPLEMKSAGFGPVPKVGQPWGHSIMGGNMTPVQGDNAPVLGPAGTVHCSMEDWGKYVAFCLRASKGDTPLISAATYKSLVTPSEGSEYAGGWIVTKRPWAGGRTLTHAGSNTQWFCVAWLAPEKGFAVLAAANSADAEAQKACDDVAGTLIQSEGK